MEQKDAGVWFLCHSSSINVKWRERKLRLLLWEKNHERDRKTCTRDKTWIT